MSEVLEGVIDPIIVFEEQQTRIEKLMATNQRQFSEILKLTEENHDLRAALALRDGFVDVVE
jgi:hypothetical protein